jgi:isopentenyl diphosphate isomerase/L-lactate dehydrogenase-like FMN-dependent dehydrogenase
MDELEATNLAEIETLARDQMEPSAFDYFCGGAGDEWTVAENRRAFSRIVFRPRVLVDVTTVRTGVSVLGTALSFPVMLAPTALNRLGHPEGEVAAARAARAAGTAMIVSTTASSTVEEVAAAAPDSLWFQLYVYKDREVTRDLVHRAEASGCRAIVLTVDMPRMGRRERDIRNAFSLPDDVTLKNLAASGRLDAARWSAESSFSAYVHGLLDPSLGWDAIAWLKSLTSLPILVKGILREDDAARAIAAGANGIVVSNHGGRQLDGAVATIDALPGIRDAIGNGVPILIDGGVRRGTDVLKALALGASAVLIGRPYLWGLAAAGEAGVARVLQLLRTELELALALVGCPDAWLVDQTCFVIRSSAAGSRF